MDNKDIGIKESGNGGEISILKGDLEFSDSFLQNIYLCLFGGNYDATKDRKETDSEERLGYWGNDLLLKTKPSKQFHSKTEKTLNEIVLNSSGRLAIIRSVEDDLFFLNKYSDLKINVVILDFNRVSINVTMNNSLNLNKEFQFVWDSAIKEVITQEEI